MVLTYRFCFCHPCIVQSAQDSSSGSWQNQIYTGGSVNVKSWIHLCAEFPPACQGDVCVLSEDCLSSGEASGQPACLPQFVLPLLTLQHQTQVRTVSTDKLLCEGTIQPKTKLHILGFHGWRLHDFLFSICQSSLFSVECLIGSYCSLAQSLTWNKNDLMITFVFSGQSLRSVWPIKQTFCHNSRFHMQNLIQQSNRKIRIIRLFTSTLLFSYWPVWQTMLLSTTTFTANRTSASSSKPKATMMRVLATGPTKSCGRAKQRAVSHRLSLHQRARTLPQLWTWPAPL